MISDSSWMIVILNIKTHGIKLLIKLTPVAKGRFDFGPGSLALWGRLLVTETSLKDTRTLWPLGSTVSDSHRLQKMTWNQLIKWSTYHFVSLKNIVYCRARWGRINKENRWKIMDTPVWHMKSKLFCCKLICCRFWHEHELFGRSV